MKRSNPKLALHRETLRGLTQRDLSGVRGASVATCKTCDSCNASCVGGCATDECGGASTNCVTHQTQGGQCGTRSYTGNGN